MLLRGTVGIIGGSGFVGYHLAQHLSQTYHVKVLDSRQPTGEKLAVQFSTCDIRRVSDLERELEDIDLVINAAIVQIPQINEQTRIGYEVNIAGTQNVCETVVNNERIKGMILAGSWHTIGERGLRGKVDEEFGFRPEMVEARARLYAFSKIAQESIVNFFQSMSEKSFCILRTGTILGEGMSRGTAASIFIENALKGDPITPYRHSMFRPMLFVDIRDVCLAYERLVAKMLRGQLKKSLNREAETINLYYPKPVTILDLAEIVRGAVSKRSRSHVRPNLTIVNTGQRPLFDRNDKRRIRVDVTKAAKVLRIKHLRSPKDSIENIVQNRISREI
jgi:UDP-glucose 4-epimerase